MDSSSSKISRRSVVAGLAAGAAALPLSRFPAIAAPPAVKIGIVAPITGELALFSQELPYVVSQIKKVVGPTIKLHGVAHPWEVVIRDTESSPNRASQVTQDLINNEKVNLITAFATPETVNPVADQCELNGMPCVTHDTPLESWFFGRKGDPKKGFEWTYHYFWSGAELNGALFDYWAKVPTNKTVGILFGNDPDGIALGDPFVSDAKKHGLTVVDTGRFDLPAQNYNAQIAAFKSANAQIVYGVLPPPEFATFWNECAQQGYKPKIVHCGKANEFAPGVLPFGKRAYGLTVDGWWTPVWPHSSSITHQTSQEFATAYEKATGRQWSMTLGFRHSLFEVAFDILRRAESLDKPDSIRAAIKATNVNTILGNINFSTGPLPNTSQTAVAIVRWIKGTKHPLELVVIDSFAAKGVPVQQQPAAIPYN